MTAAKTHSRDIDTRCRCHRLAMPVRGVIAGAALVSVLLLTLSALLDRPLRDGIAPHAVTMTGRDVRPLASRPVASFEGAQ